MDDFFPLDVDEQLKIFNRVYQEITKGKTPNIKNLQCQLILGLPGSGKSTLAQKQSQENSLVHLDSDSFLSYHPAIKALTKKYPQYVFSIKDLPLKHTKSLVYQYSEPASQRAILDNYLLSHSDLLLTTAWSSFGEIALGRMDSGNTIMITRSDPIFNPPPLVKFNRTEI